MRLFVIYLKRVRVIERRCFRGLHFHKTGNHCETSDRLLPLSHRDLDIYRFKVQLHLFESTPLW